MKDKRLGKIKRIELGFIDNSRIGIFYELGSDSEHWGVNSDKAFSNTEPNGYSKEERIKFLGETIMWVNNLLISAKKNKLSELVGIPVEVLFEDNKLATWRILEEVI